MLCLNEKDDCVSVIVEKPRRQENGRYLIKDVLVYLSKILPINYPSYRIIFSLASYSMNPSGLSEKQYKLACEILQYFRDEGMI